MQMVEYLPTLHDKNCEGFIFNIPFQVTRENRDLIVFNKTSILPNGGFSFEFINFENYDSNSGEEIRTLFKELCGKWVESGGIL